MSDIFSKAKRSDVMSRIRSRGNKATELALIRVFRTNHLTGWRRLRPVFGHPDFVFSRVRLAVFVDGCFWHSCPQHGTKPKNNSNWWEKKLSANKARDLLVSRTLKQAGWRVLRIWEHELSVRQETRLVARVRRYLAVAINRNSTRTTKGRQGLILKKLTFAERNLLPKAFSSGPQKLSAIEEDLKE